MSTSVRPSELLTARERECLRLVAAHLQSKQIARRLGIQPTTVDRHCERAMHKMGVSDRVEAALKLVADERQNDADYEPSPLDLLLSSRLDRPALGDGNEPVRASPPPASGYSGADFHMGQLEAVLVSLAKSQPKEKMVRHLLEATRKQSQFLPVEETIRDILCIGFVLMDQDFQPSSNDIP